MDDAAPGAAVASTPTYSMYQIDAVSLRLRWPVTWMLRDARGIAVIENVKRGETTMSYYTDEDRERILQEGKGDALNAPPRLMFRMTWICRRLVRLCNQRDRHRLAEQERERELVLLELRASADVRADVMASVRALIDAAIAEHRASNTADVEGLLEVLNAHSATLENFSATMEAKVVRLEQALVKLTGTDDTVCVMPPLRSGLGQAAQLVLPAVTPLCVWSDSTARREELGRPSVGPKSKPVNC